MDEQELKEKLYSALVSTAELNDLCENLQGELDRSQKENERIQASYDQSKKENDTLNDEIKHIQYSLNQTITERDDFKHREFLKDQVAERCEVLNKENKCIHASLDQSKKDNDALIEENKCIQTSLDQSKKDNDALIKENRHMQDSQKQINTRIKELKNDNNKLRPQNFSEQKAHTELTAKYLEEIRWYKSMINSLENSLVYAAQKVSLKDSDIASYKAKLKDWQEGAGLLIFPFRARVNEQRNELEHLQNELERLKLEHSSQGPNRTESSDKVQNDRSEEHTSE